MLVPVARTPGGTGAAPSPKPGTRGRDRIGVLICAGAAPHWGPWCWLLSCPQLGSCTSWDISRASWSRYAQGPEGQRPSGHEQAKQRCRGRGALPAGPRSPRDAGSIWDHSARWKPGCASRAAKGCLGASLCPHPQLLPPPAGFAMAWLPAPSQRKGPNSPQIHPQGRAKAKPARRFAAPACSSPGTGVPKGLGVPRCVPKGFGHSPAPHSTHQAPRVRHHLVSKPARSANYRTYSNCNYSSSSFQAARPQS